MAKKTIGKVGLISNLPSSLTEGFEYAYDTGSLFITYKDPESNELVRGKVKCSENTIASIIIDPTDWVESNSTYSSEKQLLFSGIILGADDILMCYPADTNSVDSTLEIFECGVNATVDISTNTITFTADTLPTQSLVYIIEINGAT